MKTRNYDTTTMVTNNYVTTKVIDTDLGLNSKLPKYMTLQKRKEDVDILSYRPASSTEKS